MVMTSTNKKRVILPTRPEPPTIEQILEDVRSARLDDPVFTLFIECSEEIVNPVQAEVLIPDVESQYQQSREYVELNRHLQKEFSELEAQCEQLKKAGDQLDISISEIKEKNFQN